MIEDEYALESAFYRQRDLISLLKLIGNYYEEKKYPLVFFYAENYKNILQQMEFYEMMSLMEMGYSKRAKEIQQKYTDEWFNLCKQYDIYWKHVALYALYFRDFELSEYYIIKFEQYYDHEIIQLLDYIREDNFYNLLKTDLFRDISIKYPVIQKEWKVQTREKRMEIMTFEKIQWKVWNNYNKQLGNGNQYGIELVYKEDELKIYSYQPKRVSASMHIITDNVSTIVLDCGCELEGDKTVRIPVKKILDSLKIEKIDGVFISHAHMDHYGSLSELQRQSEGVYMTQETKQLIQYVSPEIFPGNVTILEEYMSVKLNEIIINFIPNGHIRGSVLMDIFWKGKKRVIYTGDYTLADQETVRGLDVNDLLDFNKKRADVLITETTYGNKVIIPCFAIGRAQEIALLLKEIAKEEGFKILIDGLAGKITEFYQNITGISILNANISVCNSDLDYSQKILNNDIILASSGMIKQGSASYRYLEELITGENVCVIKVGFIQKSEYMLKSIKNRKDKNISFVDIPLSAHADYKSLIEVTEKISPECAIYVHGTGIVK